MMTMRTSIAAKKRNLSGKSIMIMQLLLSYLSGFLTCHLLMLRSDPLRFLAISIAAKVKEKVGQDWEKEESTSCVGEDWKKEESENIKEFHRIFVGTDKTWRHGYHWFYGRHLFRYRKKKGLAILEIGGRTGESALGWQKYFGNETNVDMITYGGVNDELKFNNPIIRCKGEGDKKCGLIHAFYCDQSNVEQLEKEVISARPSGWDVIVDDGSHVPAHNVISFEVLWKHVRPGGMYIIEDIETSYWPNSVVYGYKFNAGILEPPPSNSLSRFRQYVDVINRKYLGPTGGKYSLFDGDDDIMEIGYSRNVIFIKKAFNGTDSDNEGKSYNDYPYTFAKPQNFDQIKDTLVKALSLFKEQSKALDKWRTGAVS